MALLQLGFVGLRGNGAGGEDFHPAAAWHDLLVGQYNSNVLSVHSVSTIIECK